MNVLVMILFVVGALANFYLARKKNRSVLVWLVLGWYSFFLSTAVLLFLKTRQKGAFNLAPFIILWPTLLLCGFANLSSLGLLFRPFPPELLVCLLWALAYGRFLIYLLKQHKMDFVKYFKWAIVPLFLAIFFSLSVSGTVRHSFRDGVKTIRRLEEYKSKNGKYPSSIEKLGYKSSVEVYDYDKHSDSYGLIYNTGMFDTAFYNSKTKKWKGDLPVGGVPYDIIGVDQL